VAFTSAGPKIRATWGAEVSSSMPQADRLEAGRRAVLEIVNEVCDRSPELQSKWYAVSPDG
jgi:hypothetical protein